MQVLNLKNWPIKTGAVPWLGDVESGHFRMLKKHHSPSYSHWKSNPIVYQFNSEGFRGDQLAPGGLTVLGCSHAFGYGMEQSWSWPWILGRRLGLPVNCLAIPGTGSDTAARVFQAYADVLCSRAVCWLSIHTDRREFPMGYRWETVMAHQGINMLKSMVSKPEWTLYREAANRALIRELAHRWNSKLAIVEQPDFYSQRIIPMRENPLDGDILSRDAGWHPSRLLHSQLADEFEALLDDT